MFAFRGRVDVYVRACVSVDPLSCQLELNPVKYSVETWSMVHGSFRPRNHCAHTVSQDLAEEKVCPGKVTFNWDLGCVCVSTGHGLKVTRWWGGMKRKGVLPANNDTAGQRYLIWWLHWQRLIAA